MKLSRRVTEQPPYLFAEIDRARDEAKARGLDVVSMGIADPDLPPPQCWPRRFGMMVTTAIRTTRASLHTWKR